MKNVMFVCHKNVPVHQLNPSEFIRASGELENTICPQAGPRENKRFSLPANYLATTEKPIIQIEFNQDMR